MVSDDDFSSTNIVFVFVIVTYPHMFRYVQFEFVAYYVKQQQMMKSISILQNRSWRGRSTYSLETWIMLLSLLDL